MILSRSRVVFSMNLSRKTRCLRSKWISFASSYTYQPVERRLQLTRRCLEVLVEFRNPVAIVTKNYLVTRDRDVLKALAQYGVPGVIVGKFTVIVLDNLYSPYILSDLSMSTAPACPLWERSRSSAVDGLK